MYYTACLNSLNKLHILPTGWTIMGQVKARTTTEALQPIAELEEGGAKTSTENIRIKLRTTTSVAI